MRRASDGDFFLSEVLKNIKKNTQTFDLRSQQLRPGRRDVAGAVYVNI